ncbi:MAG: hypothetical protein H7X99_10695 [Saprospiraceae bacterium]|nr:hypothetical protein [Saprospiraceae bacterium]
MQAVINEAIWCTHLPVRPSVGVSGTTVGVSRITVGVSWECGGSLMLSSWEDQWRVWGW